MNKYTGDLSTLAEHPDVKDFGCDTDDNWIIFQIHGYVVEAKVFEHPREYGICKGRISKMQIRRGLSIVYNYDRGEDLNPTGKTALKILKLVIKLVDGKDT